MKYIIVFYIVFWQPIFVSGQQWQSVSSGVTNNLISLAMADRNIGWAAGDNGTVLKTTDGGFHWSVQTAGVSTSLKGIACSNSVNVWAAGSGGVIIHSGNGGQDWMTQNSGVTSDLNAICFVDDETGWACGTDNMLLRTIDGGITWLQIISAVLPTSINDVFFSTLDEGWMVAGNGAVYHSSDGGISWALQITPTTQNLVSVYFTSPLNGWIAGYNGTILHTSNGGANWVVQLSGTTNALLSVAFADAYFGIAVGNGGLILKTEDGGTTWDNEISGSIQILRSAATTGNRSCWVAGNTGTLLRQSVLNQICMVTVDTLTGKNKIIWDKVYDQGTATIKILRLDGSQYSLLVQQPFDDLSEYLDVSSTPGQHAERYKLQAVDSAGNESLNSPYHQTINLTASQGVPATSVSLAWNEYEDESGDFVPAEYYIWRGSSPSSMTVLATVPASVSIYNDENVFSQYYYYVTVEKPVPCISTGNLKETGGPYSSSFSNMEENLSGIEETDTEAFRIHVFPNPSSEQIFFELPAEVTKPVIRVSDISGKWMPLQVENCPPGYCVKTHDLPNGFYIIEIIAARLYRSSFIVNKN